MLARIIWFGDYMKLSANRYVQDLSNISCRMKRNHLYVGHIEKKGKQIYPHGLGVAVEVIDGGSGRGGIKCGYFENG